MNAVLVIVAVGLGMWGGVALWHRAVPPRRVLRLTPDDLAGMREDLSER